MVGTRFVSNIVFLNMLHRHGVRHHMHETLFFGGVSVVAALNPLMAALVDRLRTVWWGAAAQGAAIPFH